MGSMQVEKAAGLHCIRVEEIRAGGQETARGRSPSISVREDTDGMRKIHNSVGAPARKSSVLLELIVIEVSPVVVEFTGVLQWHSVVTIFPRGFQSYKALTSVFSPFSFRPAQCVRSTSSVRLTYKLIKNFTLTRFLCCTGGKCFSRHRLG